MNKNQATIFYMIESFIAQAIEETLQQLINTKHLYQNLRVRYPDSDSIYSSIKPKLISSFGPKIENTKPVVRATYNYSLEVDWVLQNATQRSNPEYIVADGVEISGFIRISPLTIKSFCDTCGDVEPYNFVQAYDVIKEFSDRHPKVQIFSLAYECQGCKGVPEAFLVRRDDTKISLCGRSPIEEVIVAPQIPKSHKKYVSDATVAFNSGQILAGIFLLRTFIEQYVRSKSKTPNTEDIDALFKEYATPLPNGFKDSFPSLKSIYDDLSTAMHGADPSEPVYSKAKDEIERHFEGIKAFRIT